MAEASSAKPNPYVALLFSDIEPGALRQLDQRSIGSPHEQIEAALTSYRMLVINRVRQDLLKQREVTGASLVRLVDAASEIYLGRFNKLVGPAAIQAYVRAYRNSGAQDIPMSTLYALAEQHASRMGTYFNETSKEALVQGFNLYLNRKIPPKAAAEKVLDAYGLTPRQMNSYVALAAPQKVTTATPRPLKAQALEYINRSLNQRFKGFARQEVHNLDQQAMQTAWVWLQEKGNLTEKAQKVWLTARDERTCAQCAPMHGKKVLVSERFKLPNGIEIYVPGVHPNCRCEARVVDPGRMKIEYFDVQKDLHGAELAEFNEEHPRGQGGRFTAKQRARATAPRPVAEAERGRPVIEPAREVIIPVEEKQLRMPDTPPEMPLRMQRQLSMPKKLAMSKPLAMPEQQLSMQRPDMASKPMQMFRGDLLRYEMPAAQRLEMQQDIKMLLMKDKERPSRPKGRRRVFRKPTIMLERPTYAIVEPREIDENGNIELTRTTEFVLDESQVAFEATENFQHQIDDVVDYLAALGGEITKTQGGKQLHAQVDEADIVDVVTTVAHRGQDNDWTGGGATTTVIWYDSEGRRVDEEDVTYDFIIDQWNLEPEDFKVSIIKLTEGHDSELGRTVQESAGTKYGNESYTTTGTYSTHPGHHTQVGHGPSIEILDLEPDVEMEELNFLDDE